MRGIGGASTNPRVVADQVTDQQVLPGTGRVPRPRADDHRHTRVGVRVANRPLDQPHSRHGLPEPALPSTTSRCERYPPIDISDLVQAFADLQRAALLADGYRGAWMRIP